MNRYLKNNLSIDVGDYVKIDGYYKPFEYSNDYMMDDRKYKVRRILTDHTGEYLSLIDSHHDVKNVCRHTVSKIGFQLHIKKEDIKINNLCIIGKKFSYLPYLTFIDDDTYENTIREYDLLESLNLITTDHIFVIIDNENNGIVHLKSLNNSLELYLPHFVLYNINAVDIYSPKNIIL